MRPEARLRATSAPRPRSSHPRWLAPALAAFALGAAAAAAPDGSPSAGAAPAVATLDPTEPEPIVGPDDVFDERVVHHYELAMPPARWSALVGRAREEQWAAARLSVDGRPWGVVGVRFKGSMGTLGSCFRGDRQVCPKLPLKLRFDRFVEGRRFFGLERLDFHALAHDPTAMRERLAYEVFAEAGIPTPRTAWARLAMNGEDLGLFALVEPIDARFSDRHFPLDDGLLYKEAWPLSQDPAYYDERLRSNRKRPQRHRQMLEFAREIAAADDDAGRVAVLERWTDVDLLMRYLAADRLVGAWDGVTAFFCDLGPCTNHNYYWYAEKHRSQLWLLPWDLDDALRLEDPLFATRDWRVPARDCDARPLAWGEIPARHPACDPLMAAFAAAARTRLAPAVEALLRHAFDPERLRARIAGWRERLRPEIASDAKGPPPATWEAEVERLLASLPRLRARGEALARGEVEEPFGLVLSRRNGFEGIDELAIWRSVRARGNPRSRVAQSLALGHALAGAADLRLDFELRNESREPRDAFLQWARLEVPFAGGRADLAGVDHIEVSVRADPARSLRIEIESPAYGSEDPALRLGWDVAAGPAPRRVRLRLRDLAPPAWSQAPGAPRAAVLSRATALCFSPEPRGRLETGFFPQDQVDAGSLAVDDVELVAMAPRARR